MSDDSTVYTPEQHRLNAVLRAVCPVGTTVFVLPKRDGVQLWVETGETTDPVTHRVVNPTGLDHITHRVAQLLGLPSNDETDTVNADGRDVVGRLSLHLHGATGSLFTADAR